MSQKLIDITRSLYQSMAAQDWETYQSHLHPDFRIVESDALPYPGTFHGFDGFTQLFGTVTEQFSEFEPNPTQLCAGGTHVMAWVEIKLTGRKTGKTLHTQLVEVFIFEDDKLIEIRPFYFDTDAINAIV